MRTRVARRTLLDLNQIPVGDEPDGLNCFGPLSRAARLASSRHVLNSQIGPPLAGVLADPAPERHLFVEDRDTMGSSLRMTSQATDAYWSAKRPALAARFS